MRTATQHKFLPYARQDIDQSDIEQVIAVLKSDYLTTGPVVNAFEKALALTVQEKYAVVVNSGTAALHLAMAALGIGPGDYVIVPAITFLATANAVRWCQAEVIFADVDPENGLMGPEQLLDVIQKNRDKNIKAVVFVHLTGQTENLSEMSKIAKKNNLFVIEDACHAIGTEYIHGSRYFIGNCRHSDVAIFSFHAVKTIAMGEGGAITTHRADLYQAALRLRNHGMNRDSQTFLHPERAVTGSETNSWYYEMIDLGLNYRATDIQCALGLSQFKKIKKLIAKRKELINWYDELLKPLFPTIKPIKRTAYSLPAWHLYSVLIDFADSSINKASLMNTLFKQGIGTQVHYIPVNEQPYYQQRYGMTIFPGARAYYEKTLSLPLHAAMEKSDVEYVVECLTEILE